MPADRPNTLTLRAATPDDAPLIERLTLAAYEEYRNTLVPASGVFSESLEEIRAEIAAGGGVIASLGDEPAGCGRCTVEGDGAYLYVGRLSVPPAFRGRGIATAMLAWFEGYARARGIPELQLGVRLNLPRNIVLYQRVGYEVFGYEEREGYGRVAAWMRKRVTP